VALASLSEPALLPAFVSTALGIREEGSPEPAFLLQALTGWLSTHEVLLVLDNCEHLVEEAASLSQTLLGRCPDLHILTTSAQRLGLTGEIAWRVPSLPCPDPEDFGFWILDFGLSDPGQPIQNPKSKIQILALDYPAVQLFVERAAMARPGFHLSEPQDAAGSPRSAGSWTESFGIELAAARVRR